jgi:hypothetical protein
MKIIKAVLLSLVILTIVPSVTIAADIVREQNGTKCLDLEAMYAEVNNSSKALTGQDNSIDAVKKAQTVATLTNIMSILIGDRVYCVNDEIAAAKTSSLKNIGVLGQITEANNQMMANFPSGGVTEHLAQEFVPGYNGNNSVLAQTTTTTSSSKGLGWLLEQAIKKVINFIGGMFTNQQLGGSIDIEQQLENKASEVVGDVADKNLQEIENMANEAEQNQVEGEEITDSGYNYLKDYLHLDTVWSVSRNIAYVFFIIIMIIAGFMIMFRKKLPGQVIVSLGNTLPQVILGIVLVTFSFAIVGTVMDAGRFTMGVISNEFANIYQKDAEVDAPAEEILTTESVNKMANQAIAKAKKDGLTDWIRDKVPLVGDGIAGFLERIGGTVTGIGFQSLALFGLNEAIEAWTENDIDIDIVVPGFDWIVDLIVEGGEMTVDLGLQLVRVGVIVFLVRNIIILLAALYASFKLFLTMMITYFKLFMNVVFGPIQIALGSLPGNFSMTQQWFKSVIANVLVFVGIHLIINLFSYLALAVDPEKFNFFGNKGVVWPEWLISLDGIIVIGGYLFAASLPNVINGMLKVEQNKEMAAAGQAVKQAAGKIPLIGGMFGS